MVLHVVRERSAALPGTSRQGGYQKAKAGYATPSRITLSIGLLAVVTFGAGLIHQQAGIANDSAALQILDLRVCG